MNFSSKRQDTHLPWRDHGAIDPAFLAGEQSEIIQAAQHADVTGIAQRFFEALADLALECLGQGRGTTRRVERLELWKAVYVEGFDLGQRLDRDRSSIA